MITLYLLLTGSICAQQKNIKTMIKQKEMENSDAFERRKKKVQTYFEKVDSGKFDIEYYNFFTEDTELYFPKFGFSQGKEGIRQFGETMAGFLKNISHDIETFNYIVSENFVVVEGTEKGTLQSGKEWPDHTIAFGKFCSVFEFEKDLIKRMYIYVDPDVASEDIDRILLLNKEAKKNHLLFANQTEMIIKMFYDIQFGKKEGNIAELFADTVDWDLPGNKEKFPWTGKRHTKNEVAAFFQELSKNVESKKFEIDFISVNGQNATAAGRLSSKILKYDKIFDTEFVVIFKVINGKIVKYHFLEDSYKLNEEMQ